MDVVFGLGFGQRDFSPFQLARLLKGHNVAKVWSVVVLGLHRLWTEKHSQVPSITFNLLDSASLGSAGVVKG